MCDPRLSVGDRRLMERLSRLEPFPASLLEMGCGDGHKLVALKRSHHVDTYGVIRRTFSGSLQSAGVDAMAATCDICHSTIAISIGC